MNETIPSLEGKIDRFLTEEMPTALRATECQSRRAGEFVPLEETACATVECWHSNGAPDASYRVVAFDENLAMRIQLNVWRFVVIYSIPEVPALDHAMIQTRLERWQTGAENAGWQVGWRPTTDRDHDASRIVQIYCYAMTARDVLDNPAEQLFWRNDIVQMTRSLMMEAQRVGIRLSESDGS